MPLSVCAVLCLRVCVCGNGLIEILSVIFCRRHTRKDIHTTSRSLHIVSFECTAARSSEASCSLPLAWRTSTLQFLLSSSSSPTLHRAHLLEMDTRARNGGCPIGHQRTLWRILLSLCLVTILDTILLLKRYVCCCCPLY